VVTQQFVVFKNPRGKDGFPFLLAVQHPLLSALPTRLAIPLAPLRKVGRDTAPRLNPIVEVSGGEYVVMTHLLGAVDAGVLQTRIADLNSKRSEIIAAIDVLISGV
jgi:toxin CcdB